MNNLLDNPCDNDNGWTTDYVNTQCTKPAQANYSTTSGVHNTCKRACSYSTCSYKSFFGKVTPDWSCIYCDDGDDSNSFPWSCSYISSHSCPDGGNLDGTTCKINF